MTTSNWKKDFISYKFIDAKGGLREKVVKKGKDGSAKPTLIDGSSFGFRETSDSDLWLLPDIPEKSHIFYDPIREMDSVFCYLANENSFITIIKEDFRYIAKCAQEKSPGAWFGVEPEFFVLEAGYPYKNRVSLGRGAQQFQWYASLPPIDKLGEIKDNLMDNLIAASFDIQSCHHEVAPSQMEISWNKNTPLIMADQMVLFKYIVSATCEKFGAMADFTPKPFENFNGNGCHTHQSLPSMRKSLEPDTLQKNRKVVDAYAQGLVDNYDELVSVCCTHEQSHKRLVPGYEAPTKENNGYGYRDRTKTVRIPADYSRVEFRLPDPMMNPYVAFSLMLKSGCEGVKKYADNKNKENL